MLCKNLPCGFNAVEKAVAIRAHRSNTAIDGRVADTAC